MPKLHGMAFQSSPWFETNGGDPEPSGRSKRLCTGLGTEPRSTVQTHWAGNQNLPEESFSESRYNSQSLDDRAWSTSAIEFNEQHVGSVGGVPGQTLFQSQQNLPWPSSDQNPQPSSLEAVSSTYWFHHRAPDARVQTHSTSNAYDPWYPPSSVINPQPDPTSAENISYGGDFQDEYLQSKVGTISQHGCEDPVADSISEGRNNVDIGSEHTSYELCLGLVGQLFW